MLFINLFTRLSENSFLIENHGTYTILKSKKLQKSEIKNICVLRM